MTHEPQSHDAHVQAAHKVFRDCGFTIAAMQYPRSAEALLGLKRFNGLRDDAKVPHAWHYHPNAHMAANWRSYYGECAA
jgi:hypothetical protein